MHCAFALVSANVPGVHAEQYVRPESPRVLVPAAQALQLVLPYSVLILQACISMGVTDQREGKTWPAGHGLQEN